MARNVPGKISLFQLCLVTLPSGTPWRRTESGPCLNWAERGDADATRKAKAATRAQRMDDSPKRNESGSLTPLANRCTENDGLSLGVAMRFNSMEDLGSQVPASDTREAVVSIADHRPRMHTL